ncbi:hypothetical protein [Nesterenkonia alba]|uniref:hypothetical protein n=1 Tax=Nesterenkonia alba TaxID=515814 RepID=UPI0003B76D7E|nr:hypothetical protein [Nesterenkonia alba]
MLTPTNIAQVIDKACEEAEDLGQSATAEARAVYYFFDNYGFLKAEDDIRPALRNYMKATDVTLPSEAMTEISEKEFYETSRPKLLLLLWEEQFKDRIVERPERIEDLKNNIAVANEVLTTDPARGRSDGDDEFYEDVHRIFTGDWVDSKTTWLEKLTAKQEELLAAMESKK